MSKCLLQEPEYNGSKVRTLYEAGVGIDGKPSKRLKIIGTAIVTDIPGINGRSYSKNILAPEVKRFNDKFISKGRAIAELNHPRLTPQGDGKDYSVFEINLMKACALIEELHFKGNELLCKMAVVPGHPAGDALKALLDAGYVPGYSLRGAGSVVESGKGYMEVGDDYRLITIDVVGNPSFDDMALVSVMHEAIYKSKINVLTEAVEMANKEFMINCDHMSKIRLGKKQFSRDALVTWCESISSTQPMI
jgi:hypothetical protein